jgi:hypothetical protein
MCPWRRCVSNLNRRSVTPVFPVFHQANYTVLHPPSLSPTPTMSHSLGIDGLWFPLPWPTPSSDATTGKGLCSTDKYIHALVCSYFSRRSLSNGSAGPSIARHRIRFQARETVMRPLWKSPPHTPAGLHDVGHMYTN